MEHTDYEGFKLLGYGVRPRYSISVSDLGEEFQILNIYGPYQNRAPFWDNLLTSLF
jgi:hypothetical protein